jgi:hypothetical protein
MSEDFRKMIRDNKTAMEKMHLATQEYINVSRVTVGCLTGRNDQVDLKVAEMEVDITPSYRTHEISASEILANMRSQRNDAQDRGDKTTSEACTVIIGKYKADALEELLSQK